MISTGTDIKPLECLLFMRDVKSQGFFDQMKGRGTRVISSTDLNDESRNIIINSKDGYVGLVVGRISDVVRADWDKAKPPPANIGGVQGKFFKGVFKTENSLIVILNVEEVLKTSD